MPLPADASILWDLEDEPDGNYQHIVVDNGVSVEEFEEVLSSSWDEAVLSRSSGRPAGFGWTSTGKHLFVVWEEVSDEPCMIRPVTAYEVDPN